MKPKLLLILGGVVVVIVAAVVTGRTLYKRWAARDEIMPGLRCEVKLVSFSGSDTRRNAAVNAIRGELAKRSAICYAGRINSDASYKLIATFDEPKTEPYTFLDEKKRFMTMDYPVIQLSLELLDNRGNSLCTTQSQAMAIPDKPMGVVTPDAGEDFVEALSADAWLRAAGLVRQTPMPMPDGKPGEMPEIIGGEKPTPTTVPSSTRADPENSNH